MRRSPVRWVAPVLLATAIPFATAGPVAAEPGQAPVQRYVALGDSYAAGPLIPVQVPLFGCLKSNNNYANLTARDLGLPLRDATCSGAETEDMENPQNVEPDGPNPPQFDRLSKHTRIVSLQVGGNDIGFSSIAEDCASATSKTRSGSPRSAGPRAARTSGSRRAAPDRRGASTRPSAG